MNSVCKWLNTEKEGPDKGAVMLGLSTGETESILCAASILAFIANHSLQGFVFFPICQITKETELSKIFFDTFQHLGFLLCYSILGKSGHILKHYEMTGLVCLSLN